MSRSIAESLSLLSETLGNCKTNLKEKEVTDVDNIKISDVDEKIAEIKSGGGSSSGFKNIKDVTYNLGINTSSNYCDDFNPDGAQSFDLNLQFTVSQDDCYILYSDNLKLNPESWDMHFTKSLTKETTYTITAEKIYNFFVIIFKGRGYGVSISDIDFIGYSSK